MNEFMFNTIAVKSNLKVVLVEEFKFKWDDSKRTEPLFKKSEIRIKIYTVKLKTKNTKRL